MYGSDFLIRIAEHYQGFGTPTVKAEGLFLDADSESLVSNIEYEEGANKLKGDRSIVASDFVKRSSSPGGGMVYQPRSNNAWMLFMANLQCVDVNHSNAAGTLHGGSHFIGTLTFTPSKNSDLDWSGSTWGTVVANVGTGEDVYCVRVDKMFGGAIAYATNAHLFEQSIVDALQIRCNYGEDVMIEPTFKSYNFRGTQLGAASFNNPAAYGSFSTKQRLADWHATFTIQGTAYDVQSLTMNLQNQTAERGRIGKFGWSKFPFGKILHEGEFTLEFADPTLFPVNGTGTILLHIFGGTNDWIKVTQYNAVYRSHDPNADSGDAIVEETIPYRAVMNNAKTVAETVVQIAVDSHAFGRVSGMTS